MRKILLIFVLAIGLFFRFNNLNWDDNHHLHPDERFLTMVGKAMVLPKSINEYLDPKASKLNPHNIGYNFFVYGTFPLIINKYLSVFFKSDNYNNYTLLGRQLSAFFDLLTIIITYKIAKILFPKKKSISYWSGIIYALSVLPIQLSHFFTVDSFLNFFLISSFYFILRFTKDGGLIFLFLSSLFFSFGLASKITAFFILPLILVLIFIKENSIKKKFFYLVLFFVFSYFSLRFSNPYYFENKNFFNPTISFLFVENIKQLKYLTRKSLDIWYPPSVQWLSKNSFQHAVVNNAIFGMGLVQTIFVIKGMILTFLKFKNQSLKIKITRQDLKLKKQETNKKIIFIILLWVISVFFYLSFQSTPTLRYFIFLYPFLAMFSGFGFYWLIQKLREKLKSQMIFYVIRYPLYVSLFIWPLMFSSIYNQKHTRVIASEWIYQKLPNQSIILGESWDDSLPLYTANNYGKSFITEQLPVFDPDSEEKWKKMKELLKKADYYILSSNRGWGSIPTVPEKYPKMSFYYRALLNNDCPKQKKMVDVCYHKIKEFTSYPTLKIPFFNWQFSFDDQWADESFTVYDHPKVMVYKKI